MVDGWSEEALLGTFIDGLKPWLAKELKLKQPARLQEAMRMAEILDQSGYHDPRLVKASASQLPSKEAQSTTPATSKKLASNIKKLSHKKLQEYIKKGLCFCYGAWWKKGHKCVVGQAHTIQILSSEGETNSTTSHSDAEIVGVNELSNDVELSLHVLSGV